MRRRWGCCRSCEVSVDVVVGDDVVDVLTMQVMSHGYVSAVLCAGVEDAGVCLPCDRKGVGVEIHSLI